MSITKGRTFLYFMLWLCCLNCDCQCHGISTREAKSFYQSRPSPYLMTNDFTPLYVKKDHFKHPRPEEKIVSGKESGVENNQVTWVTENAPVTSTESSNGKNYWLTEFGETDKIITVRVSSSVAVASNYVEKPKLAALQRIGFDVEVPAANVQYRSYSPPPAGNDSEGRYYETRIEAVSSRKEVVFGRSKPVTSTTPHYDEYYGEPREEFCETNYETPEKNYEVPETNYETPEKNYEVPETNYETPEKNYEVPEKNYEVDEAVSLMNNGNVDARTMSEEKGKLGYVVEGRNYRKYRVEERTPDGFIVGEYGFIRNEDGKLHGVRYTADVNANPRLIYDALVKFLSL